MYGDIERHERFGERTDLKSIAEDAADCDKDVDGGASGQVTAGFSKVTYVVVDVEDRRLELLDVS